MKKQRGPNIIRLAPRRMQASPISYATNANSKYLVLFEAIHAYRNPTSATELEPEPQFDPPRQSDYQCDPEVIANQWQSEDPSQYDPSYNFDPWAYTNLGQKPKLGGVRISHRHYIHVHTLMLVVGAHTFSL